MAIPTISETVSIGDVSTYLIGNDNAKGSLFGKRLSAPGSMVSVAIITDALRWGNDGGAETAQNLRSMANYLIWLCGLFGQQAQYILQSAGGGSVIPGGSSYAYINLVDTIVSQGSTYSNSYFVGATQISTMTVNGGPLQTVAGGDFSVNTTTGVLTWSQTFFAGDIINLTFLRLI